MQKIKAKAILFDKDGTLLEFAPFWQAVSVYAVRELANSFNLDNVVAEKALKEIGVGEDYFDVDGLLCKGTYGQIAKAMYPIFTNAGVSIKEDEWTDLCVKVFHKNIEKGVVLPTSKNLKSALQQLKERGKKLYVVTSDDEHTTSVCLKGLGIDNLFNKVYVDDGVNPHKPDPYNANVIMRENGFLPEDLVMVGDTLSDANFAKNAGIKCIGIVKTEQGKKLLDGNVTVMVEDISKITEIVE